MILIIFKLTIKEDKTGNKRATSISNSKNKITKIKNRIEKGVREHVKGSNPHSNGARFSELDWFDNFEINM